MKNETLTLVIATTLLASVAKAQISIAPEIGLNLANMHSTYKDPSGGSQKADNGIKLGVKAGANVNIPIGDRLVVQPGLFYSIKGAKGDESENYTLGGISYKDEDKNNITLHYFEIPVNVQYMFNDPDEGRFFVGLGVYMGVAFSGKNIAHSEQTVGTAAAVTSDTTYHLKFGNDYPSNDLRRFDFGGQVYAGYQLKSGIFFRAMYQQGLINLVPQGNQSAGAIALDENIHTTNITISLGYMLGGSHSGGKHKKGGSM